MFMRMRRWWGHDNIFLKKWNDLMLLNVTVTYSEKISRQEKLRKMDYLFSLGLEQNSRQFIKLVCIKKHALNGSGSNSSANDGRDW